MTTSADFSSDWLKLLQKLKGDPVLFCRYVLNFEPFDYQSTILRDDSKRILACLGRQTGKSTTIAARAIWFAMTHPKTTTLVISATLRQSILTFEKIRSFIESRPLISACLKDSTQTHAKFRNGSVIVALPCGRTGYSLRGFTAHQIIMDEAAFMPESVITQVAMPMLATTQGRAIMLSTPYDKRHFFYRAFSSDNWSKYHFPSSISPLITKEYLEEQLSITGEKRFAQEFLAEFVDDSKAYFPMSLLRSCIHCCEKAPCSYCECLGDWKKISGELYAGYDPGGRSDPAALVVVKKENSTDDRQSGPVFKVVLTKTYLSSAKESDENLYTRFTVEISDIHQKLRFRKLLVDSTGLGQPIVEHCTSLKLPAEGFVLSSKNKEAILSNLQLLLEQKRLVLPQNLDLLNNLNVIEVDRTRSGGYAFTHPEGTHDDLSYALALALQAAKNPAHVVMMTS